MEYPEKKCNRCDVTYELGWDSLPKTGVSAEQIILAPHPKKWMKKHKRNYTKTGKVI